MRLGLKTRQLMIKEYQDRIKNAKFVLVTNFKGVDANGMKELRQKLSKNSYSYLVVKNILFKKAIEESELISIEKFLEGEVGIAYGENDPIKLSKLLIDFTKEYDTFKIRGGLLEGKLVEEKLVKELASLPGEEALISRLVGSLRSPLQRLVRVLISSLEQLVLVLKAIKEKKEGGKDE